PGRRDDRPRIGETAGPTRPGDPQSRRGAGRERRTGSRTESGHGHPVWATQPPSHRTGREEVAAKRSTRRITDETLAAAPGRADERDRLLPLSSVAAPDHGRQAGPGAENGGWRDRLSPGRAVEERR